MAIQVFLGMGFLLLLKWPVWGWLTAAGAGLSGSVLAAYAIVLVTLAVYRSALGDRLERARSEARALDRRVPESPAPAIGALTRVLESLGLMSLGLALILALTYAPQEKTMGQVQRIFYIHVPSAWIAGLAFAVVAGGSIGYLWRRHNGADRVARSAAEIGVIFTSLVLITGPIWAKPAWGMWWAWDARLTTTLILWLIYVGYLMLRVYVTEPARERTLAAVVGILGFIAVPIDYYAIQWWRTQHPAPVFGGGENSGLDPAMGRAFAVGLVAFTLVFLALFARRLAIAALEERNDDRARVAEEQAR